MDIFYGGWGCGDIFWFSRAGRHFYEWGGVSGGKFWVGGGKWRYILSGWGWVIIFDKQFWISGDIF